MTAVSEDLGVPWLSSVPGGAVVLRRDVREYVVAAVAVDHVAARIPGDRRRRLFDLALVAADERGLLRPGARLWVVTERWCVEGPPQSSMAIRVRRAGVADPQSAFLPNPTSPKGAS